MLFRSQLEDLRVILGLAPETRDQQARRHRELGQANLAKSYLPAAAAEFEALHRLDPTDSDAVLQLGYVYNQMTGDSGANPALGGFRSRVSGIGPQIGFFFPVADRDGYLNLRGYYEFDAKNRLEGWTAYITFSVEAAERKPGEPRPARPATFPR